MKFLLKPLFCLSLVISSYACSDDDNNNKPTICPGPLAEEIMVIDTLKVEEIKGYYKTFLEQTKGFSGLDAEAELAKVKYDVVFTSIKYQGVDPFGKVRTLSGLVGYPILPATKVKVEKELRIASIQHGTIALESQAPSKSTFEVVNPIRDILTLVIPAHESGYVVVMPDYFGYGTDEAQAHYYEHRPTLAAASKGLIDVIPEYAGYKGLKVNTDKLFLLGYSEGGFATMSTLKSFSEQASQFKDFVTVAGAGAYDKEITATRIVGQKTGDSPTFTASYAWVLLSYNSAYKINRDLDKLFQPAVLPEIKGYVGNDRIMQSQTLPSEPVNVFLPAFAQGLVDKTDKPYMEALKDNNVSDFAVKGSLDLIHGSADTWVPTYNTDSAYVRLQKRGVKVEKTIVPNGTHATTYPFFVIKALNKL